MRIDIRPTRRWVRFAVVVLLGLFLTACGTDDGKDEPTATSEPGGAQPTVAVEESTVSVATPGLAVERTPTNTDMSAVPSHAATAEMVATPAPVTAGILGSPEASPVSAAGQGATPTAGPATGANATPVTAVAVSPEVAGQVEAGPAVGDGTTGASVEASGAATPATARATPVASPVVAGASPVATPIGATPAAAVTVTGCDVPNVPPYAGEQTVYALTTDVNFRSGPGVDCDLALQVPLGEFQQVLVIGGPVIRADDGSEWVQIEVQGTVGWVSFDLLEPVE